MVKQFNVNKLDDVIALCILSLLPWKSYYIQHLVFCCKQVIAGVMIFRILTVTFTNCSLFRPQNIFCHFTSFETLFLVMSWGVGPCSMFYHNTEGYQNMYQHVYCMEGWGSYPYQCYCIMRVKNTGPKIPH